MLCIYPEMFAGLFHGCLRVSSDPEEMDQASLPSGDSFSPGEQGTHFNREVWKEEREVPSSASLCRSGPIYAPGTTGPAPLPVARRATASKMPVGIQQCQWQSEQVRGRDQCKADSPGSSNTERTFSQPFIGGSLCLGSQSFPHWGRWEKEELYDPAN